jgi:hypothetical protein
MDSPPQTPQSHHRQNRSGEAEYAGPLQPETPPSSVSNSTAKRLKRSGGSSDSDQTALGSHQLVVEDYRVAGPVYLPLPVMRGYGVAERYQSAWNAGLKSEVHRILSRHHISQSFVNLQKHITERSHAEPRSAVYIFIEDKELSNHAEWRFAARSILELCRQRGLDDLNVEIADPRELVPKISATISPTLSIVPLWESLLPDIMNALKPNVDWLTIDLISRASWADFDSIGSASFVPTILIMIKESTEESYTAARDKICELLDPRFPEVAVEVIRGCLEACADTRDYEPRFEHHGNKLWQEEAYMGASIQRAGSKGTGTLGCFIKLHDQQGVARTYGLTNFHVAIPDPEKIESHDDQTQLWIKNGLPPGFGRNFQINMPSEIDLDAARDKYAQLTKGIEGDMTDNNEGYKLYLTYDREYRRLAAEGLDPELFMAKAAVRLVKDVRERLIRYRERIAAIDARKNNLRLGQIFAGSGLRQTGSRQLMDWAIIEVDDTRIPAGNDLPTEICHMNIYSPQMNKIGSLGVHDKVFKTGRSSSETYGFINPVQTTELWGWTRSKGKLRYKVGQAWVVVDRTKDDDEGRMRGSKFFSDKGDSGAAIFNQNGEFVGLLHGGTYPERNMSYVMAARVLVDDIKRITGAVEVTML